MTDSIIHFPLGDPESGKAVHFLNGCMGTEKAPHARVYFFADVEIDRVKAPEWQGHCPVCILKEESG